MLSIIEIKEFSFFKGKTGWRRTRLSRESNQKGLTVAFTNEVGHIKIMNRSVFY